MTGKTVTRADLCEAVYQKVGLSRTESATLVELVLKEITDCLERGETVKLSSFGSFVVRKKGQRSRAQSQDRQGSTDLAAAGDGVQAVGNPQAAHQRRFRFRREEVAAPARPGEQGDGGQGTGRVPHHQRSGGGARRSAARAAVLGEPVPRDQADEARRRPALLSSRRRRPAARHPPSALWRGLHHPRRAAPAAGAGPAVRAECLAAGRAAAGSPAARGCLRRGRRRRRRR